MTVSIRRACLVTAGLAVALTVPAASQSPAQQPGQTPTFKAEVEYVEVDALVTDERGEVVRDLKKEDFQILEDGKSQPIAGFAFIEIPTKGDRPAPAYGAVEPDVRGNEPFAGRVYVMVLDNLHTAALRAPRVKRAAQQFIERYLAPNDVMAVVQVGNSSAGGSQEFTGSKSLLLAAVDRFMGQKLDSATMARNELFFAGPSVATGDVPDPFEAERGFNARSTTRVLTEVAEKLSVMRGRRKSILFISEGIDYDITDVIGNRSASSVLDGIREAIDAATRSNASIFAVDPRGLTGIADDLIETGILADQRPLTAAADPDAPQGAQRRTGIGTGSLRNELQLAQDSLRTLADETNGFAAVNSNDFDSAFERIVSANSAYYVLAYYPPSNRRDGKFHRIEVRTVRPGLTVRARRGYVAPRPAKPARQTTNDIAQPLQRALNNALPTSNIRMRVFAAPLKGTAPNVSVVIGTEVGGGQLTLADNAAIQLAYVAIDASGEVRADNDAFTFKLPPDAKARVKQAGIRFLKRLNLPPGRYQLRVGVYDTGGDTVGTANYDLEVPDFNKLPFGMSGLFVTSKAATSTVTARADPELQKFLPAPPVSLREFPPGDDAAVTAEIYDRAGTTPHRVDIHTTVRSQDGKVVFEHSDERSSEELQGAAGGFVHRVDLPVGQLAPGTYLLTMEARSRLGQTVSRQFEFGVTSVP